ncbi:MAG TPA: ABC-three component system protein [Candidatus Thermoplasmatota archaeon]|nr:ABC-three component system protein [Candidatus Thermoplasmatota archaeon]
MADKRVGAPVGETRNRSGKTSLVELLHFLLGERPSSKSLLRHEKLKDHVFGMTATLGNGRFQVERSGRNDTEVTIKKVPSAPLGPMFVDDRHTTRVIPNQAWANELGRRMFGLSEALQTAPRKEREPSFRMLFPYFARRQQEGGFHDPTKMSSRQNDGDRQVALSFLLGLEWRLAREWQDVRDKESGIKALKKLAEAGSELPFARRVAELQPRLLAATQKATSLRTSLETMQVHPEYARLRDDADRLTQQASLLLQQDVVDDTLVREIDTTLAEELPVNQRELFQLYEEIGVLFPPSARRRYEEVAQFHQAVVANRRGYLSEERTAALRRMAERRQRIASLDNERAGIMQTLSTHSAAEQFRRLERDLVRREAEIESLRKEIETAQQIDRQKGHLMEERHELKSRLERANGDQGAHIEDLRRIFESVSESIYQERKGSLEIKATPKGIDVRPRIHGDRSTGIRMMQTFAFDLTLMSVWSKEKLGPGFLVHDSHLFDPVDADVVDKAISTAEQRCRAEGWQYVVTLNTDSIPSSLRPRIEDVALPIRLADTETGGLFGFRFD